VIDSGISNILVPPSMLEPDADRGMAESSSWTSPRSQLSQFLIFPMPPASQCHPLHRLQLIEPRFSTDLHLIRMYFSEEFFDPLRLIDVAGMFARTLVRGQGLKMYPCRSLVAAKTGLLGSPAAGPQVGALIRRPASNRASPSQRLSRRFGIVK
jgi:hypothetical protein